MSRPQFKINGESREILEKIKRGGGTNHFIAHNPGKFLKALYSTCINGQQKARDNRVMCKLRKINHVVVTARGL